MQSEVLYDLGNKTAYGDLDYWGKFTVASSYSWVVVCLLTAFVLIGLTWFVISKIGSKDRVIISMLICLTMACLASALFFSFLIVDSTHPNRTDLDRAPFKQSSFECANFVSGFLPSIFLCLAVILNINKWMYFRWRVESLKE
jgi:hypothetical protein